MKKERGITLISVIIYVISMLIVISIIATITGFFYKNVNTDTTSQDIMSQYSKFNSIFSVEVNRYGNRILEVGTEEGISKKQGEDEFISGTYIVFSSGNQYTFQNNSLYKNNMKIAENVQGTFSYQYINSEYKIKVLVSSENQSKSKVLNYTIK